MSLATPKSFLLAALVLPLLTAGGCATRSSVELAQTAANTADAHAADARTHADAAQARADSAQAKADGAQARADEAAGIGGNALTTAQDDAQRVALLETKLQKADTRIAYLQRNVVYKKVVHRKRPLHRHVVKKPLPKPKDQTTD